MKYIVFAMIGIALSLVTLGMIAIYGYFFTDEVHTSTVGQAIVWIIAGVALFMSAHHIKGSL